MLQNRKKSHFEFSIGINFKEFLEGFFEYWVSKGVCHDIKTSCLLKARLHLQNTDLIYGCYEHIYHHTCFLRSVGKSLIEFDGVFQVLGVLFLLLDI